MLCEGLVIMMPDPPKYRVVHLKLRKIFHACSPDVDPKSIDEAVIDFAGTPTLKRGLAEVGREIKKRVKDEIGEWMTCNVGIGTNRFLAKTAASLHKPDGLDVVTHENLEATYAGLELLDLCGINVRYQARLNAAGIFTPLEFLAATREQLMKEVFRSVNGHHWYLRLRGWESDAIDFGRKSFGQSYAIMRATDDPHELAKLLMKLVEKMGRQLRRGGSAAQGLHVSCLYRDGTHWHQGRTFAGTLYATSELYRKAVYVLNKQPVR